MKLEYIADKLDRRVAALVGDNLNEKYLRLNPAEKEIIRQAQGICKKAAHMLEDYYQDPDLITSYTEADIALSNILEKEGS